MKPPATRKRETPDLPTQFESLQELESSQIVTIQERRLQDIDAPDLRLEKLRIDGSLVERVRLAGSQFGSATWKDVRFTGCDLANVRAHRIELLRVEFVDCRLTGFSTGALKWQDVLIQNGDLRYSQFREASFRHCEFEGCDWQDADLQNADLSGAIFRSCKLARADLHGANLQDTDLRTSEVEGMLIGMGDLRGAIVGPVEAMVLARVLGLQIR